MQNRPITFPLRPFLAATVLAAAALALSAQSAPAANPLDALPPTFIENRGQWDDGVLFQVRRGPVTARAYADALALRLAAGDGGGVVVRLVFDGAREETRVEGVDRQAGAHHFFVGADPERHRADVPAFAAVRYRGLHEGVDLVLRDNGSELEYDLLFAAGVDPHPLVVTCEGVDAIALGPGRELVLITPVGELRQSAPQSWQLGADGAVVPVTSRFRVLDENRFAFEVERRDPSLATVVDPGLVWSTLLGGSDNDDITAMEVDPSDGEIVVVGATKALDFPITAGAFQTSKAGGTTDAFVARLNPTGTALVFSTYVGGTFDETAWDVALDSSGRAVVVGNTLSSDFPTTAGAMKPGYGGGNDAFAFRLSADGSSMEWCTYMGTDRSDTAHGVALDSGDGLVIVGDTSSPFFPYYDGTTNTVHPYPYFAGGFATFLSAGGGYGWNLFLAGSGSEGAVDVAINDDDLVVAVGTTGSANFPVTAGAYDTVLDGTDGFVARIASGSATPVWATFLGGTFIDNPAAVTWTSDDRVVVVGSTRSADYPTTTGAYQESHGGGNFDGVLSILDSSGSSLLVSTHLGGSDSDFLAEVRDDSAGELTVGGWTYSTDFPTTLGAYRTTGALGTASDAVLARFDSGVTDLAYSTLLGDTNHDEIRDLAILSDGDVIVAGETHSSGFPTTSGAIDTTFAGGTEGIVVRLDPESSCPASATYRNAGANPPSYTATAPVLGTTVTATVSLSTTGHSFALLYGYDSPFSFTLGGGQVLLIIDGGGGEYLTQTPKAGPTAIFSLPVPDDASLCGLAVYTQALHFGGVTPFALSNAVDLVLGS